MKDQLEHIVLTTLAAYGLIKIFEGLFERPRPTVIVVQADQDLVRDLLDEGDGES